MPELINIAEALRTQAGDRPDGLALIVPTRRVGGQWRDRRWTWRQMNDLCDRLAGGLQRRLGRATPRQIVVRTGAGRAAEGEKQLDRASRLGDVGPTVSSCVAS